MTVHNYCGFHKVTECWNPSYGWEPGVYSVTPIVPMFTRVCFDVKIWVKNLPGDNIATLGSIVVSDRFGGDVAVEGWSLEGAGAGSIETRRTGQTEKVHLTWDIEADLEDDEVVLAILNVCTDINPGQAKKDDPKYEYTEPCYHELNSGAVVKFTDPMTGNQLSAHTPPILVKVVPPIP